MKPLRTRLQEARQRLGLPWEVIERDYLLSWILAGIAHVDALRASLVFKGGTALRKCYFGDYRFSEDLDFTGVGKISRESLNAAIGKACSEAVRLVDPYAPIDIVFERHAERDPHPGGQEAFDVRARLPWHRTPQTHVMIEITVDEKVMMSTRSRPVIHDYGEPLDAKVNVYGLEEIVAEKLRAILQHARALEERGWIRSRARDYYDLWRILGRTPEKLNLSGFVDVLKRKCSARDVAFSGPESFFPEKMLSEVERTWRQWLGRLVPNLPPYKRVVGELRPWVARLLERSR